MDHDPASSSLADYVSTPECRCAPFCRRSYHVDTVIHDPMDTSSQNRYLNPCVALNAPKARLISSTMNQETHVAFMIRLRRNSRMSLRSILSSSLLWYYWFSKSSLITGTSFFTFFEEFSDLDDIKRINSYVRSNILPSFCDRVGGDASPSTHKTV